jgi:hypothetical protein
MQMMLGRAERLEAHVVDDHGELTQLPDHLLDLLIVAPNRAQALSFLRSPGHRREYEEVEFHLAISSDR